MTKFTWVVAAILPLCRHAAANETPRGEAGAVKPVVESTVNSIIGVLKDKAKDRDMRRTEIFAIVDPVVDLLGVQASLVLFWGAIILAVYWLLTRK